MKILHVITSLTTGGAEKLAMQFAIAFRKEGLISDIAIFDGQDTPMTKIAEQSQCVLYRFTKGGSVYNPLYIIKLIRLMRNYDIIHAHNTSPQFFVAIANIFCHKKIVTTEHNTTNRRRNIWWFKPLDKWMYSRYNHIVCISDKAEENLKQYLGKGYSNISTIYNGIDINAFNSALPLDKLKTDKFVIVMVAAFRKQKDQDTLVKAMDLLPKGKYELWLVGDGERINEVKNLVQEMNLNENVKFFGNRTDVPNILKSADVVVMSTHYEGLSLSNIEGMAVGKPFIASDVDGIQEVTKDAGVLVPHQDAEALANEIKHLSEDRDYYNMIAERCLIRAKMYDISKTVDGYLRVYDELENK
jgi:glycosyltransferase involved in cell wall biosynthesis